MMPPASDVDSTAARGPIELPPNALAQLRTAGGWARFVAIVSFVLTGLVGLASVALLVAQSDQGMTAARFAGTLATFVWAILVAGGAASLMWRYGQDTVAFFTHGTPALARAFRSLRRLVVLWIVVVALATAWQVASLLAKLF